MDFLLFLHEGIELRDTLERQLVHEVDDVWLLQPAVLELLDGDGERGRVEHDLAILGQEADKLPNNGLELC